MTDYQKRLKRAHEEALAALNAIVAAMVAESAEYKIHWQRRALEQLTEARNAIKGK